MASIGSQIASGAAWMMLFRIFERFIGVISTLILARLLVPEDFGLIAMAMSFVAILDILWAFSFDAALIQQKDIQKSHFDSAWTLNVIVGSIMAAGLVAVSYPASVFYEDERLVPLICCLAIGEVFRGFENIGVVLFRKELRFGSEFGYQLGRKLCAFAVTIPLAFIFRNYWALAIGMITGRFAALVLSYVVHPFRPWFSLVAWRSLVGFSQWLLLNSAIFAIQSRAQDFIVGKISGPAGLGLYNISHELSTMATSEVVFPINRAVFPGFAKMAEEDPAALLRGYVSVISLVAIVTLPLGFGISATADWMIPVVLGDKWLAAIPVVQILGAYGALASLGSVFGPTLMAIGKARLLSVLSACNVSIFVPAVIFGTIEAEFIGAAWGALTAVTVMLPFSHWLVARTIKVPLGHVLANVWRPFFSVALMFVCVREFVALMSPRDGLAELSLALIIAVAIGAVVYVGSMLILWLMSGRPDGGEKLIVDFLREKLGGKPAIAAGSSGD